MPRCYVTTLAIALGLSVAAATSCAAQAGSTGGSIGEVNKSVSGGGASAKHHGAPSKSPRKRSSESQKRVASHEESNQKAGRPIGCFRDTNAPLDLNGYIERSQANTPGRCVAICKSKGFRYAGVQYGESCLCGNSYGRYGPANNCTMACTGNPSETCGGGFANYVYATGAR